MAFIPMLVLSIATAAYQKRQADSAARKQREAQKRAALLGQVGEGGEVMDPEMTPTDFAGLMGMGAQSGFMGSRFRDLGIG